MKKVTISIEYEEEKIKALKHFLKQKDEKDIAEKLVDTIESLYKKTVPVNVREYIEATTDGSSKTAK
ncbi:MAG: hypothetical protein IIX39_05335 [Clostridia bacterium]|nr:hypothetical protein [Clostridia bacterium]